MTTQIDSSELKPYTVIGVVSKWIDGKVTASEILGASRHPKMRIVRAWAQLIETGDATTTITVKLTNGSTDCSDTLTFTQGTEVIGDVKAFTMVSNQDVILSGDALTATTSGTTTTAGEVMVFIQFELT